MGIEERLERTRWDAHSELTRDNTWYMYEVQGLSNYVDQLFCFLKKCTRLQRRHLRGMGLCELFPGLTPIAVLNIVCGISTLSYSSPSPHLTPPLLFPQLLSYNLKTCSFKSHVLPICTSSLDKFSAICALCLSPSPLFTGPRPFTLSPPLKVSFQSIIND